MDPVPITVLGRGDSPRRNPAPKVGLFLPLKNHKPSQNEAKHVQGWQGRRQSRCSANVGGGEMLAEVKGGPQFEKL